VDPRKTAAPREWLLLGASVTATVVLGLTMLRWLAPGLLGVAADLQIVQLSREVVPFYDNAFREEDAASTKFILNDPVTIVRAQPFRRDVVTGPTDLLGFRNHAVPNRADAIVIGDSQTFGLNVPLEHNWPSRLADLLTATGAQVYAMATGGWGAVQYLDMFQKALAFEPAVVIVAFYSGNDAIESFRAAYGVEHWSSLRVDSALTANDHPPKPPKREEDVFEAPLANGTRMVFTPGRRFYANREHPVVDAGWRIMAEVGRRIGQQALRAGVRPIFTVIPTKELVHAPQVRRARANPPEDYVGLLQVEARRIDELRAQLSALEGATYVDLLQPLRRTARREGPVHLSSADGHPSRRGYTAIAKALAPTVAVRLGEVRAAQAGDSPAAASQVLP
jgi:lysophospholipase L1-like esterase